MTDGAPRRRHWFRFTLGQLMVLTLGVALGFLPLRLWEYAQGPQPHVIVSIHMVEVPRDQLAPLGLESPTKQGSSAVLDETAADSLHQQLDALTAAGKVKVISTPTLMTLSGQQAVFSVGSAVPVIAGVKDGSPSSVLLEIGTRVEMTPTLLRNGRIKLCLEPQISQLDYNQSVTVDGHRVPAVRSRSMQADIEIGNGQTVVLTGPQQPPAAGQSAAPQSETLMIVEACRVETVPPTAGSAKAGTALSDGSAAPMPAASGTR